MKFLAYARSLAARFLRRSRIEDEMEEEVRAHIQHRTDDLERSGLDRAEAERRARIEFGGRQRFREECYEAIAGNFIEILINDLRVSVRILRKSPGFTAVAVLTLALATGANGVVFGVLNGLILRPLNVPQAESLYGSEYGDGSGWQSYPNYRDLRDRNRSFDDLAAFNFAFVGFDTGNNDPAHATGFATTGNYFDVLKLGESELAVCIGDVAGKGMPAALLMSGLQASVRVSAFESRSPCARFPTATRSPSSRRAIPRTWRSTSCPTTR